MKKGQRTILVAVLALSLEVEEREGGQAAKTASLEQCNKGMERRGSVL